MAELLFQKILNNDIEIDQFLEWFVKFYSNGEQCFYEEITNSRCSQADFLTFFLNFIHEDIPAACAKWANVTQDVEEGSSNVEKVKNRNEIEKSKSFPLELSKSLLEDDAEDKGQNHITSTPKMIKINSESSVLSNTYSTPIQNSSYMSPISPLYHSNNTHLTPKNLNNSSNYHQQPKSPLCLGDFLVNQRSQATWLSTRKNRSRSTKENSNNSNNNNNNNENIDIKQRRINPTNITNTINATNFQKFSENSYSFINNDQQSLLQQQSSTTNLSRNHLAEERVKLLSRRNSQDSSITPTIQQHQPRTLFSNSRKILERNLKEIQPKLNQVQFREQLDKVIQIYIKILNCYLVLNLTSEIQFLISLLLKKQFFTNDIQPLQDKFHITHLFSTIHNLIYFISKALESQLSILKNYDRTTLKLLSENMNLIEFVPEFTAKILEISENNSVTILLTDRTVDNIEFGAQENVNFNSDTDVRQNFLNDVSFHSFRKQRDLFYEILRLWELQHLNQDYSFQISLGGKIKSLLSLCNNEPSNFIHFARLFKSQLLSTCRNIGTSSNQIEAANDNIIPANLLPINTEKLNRLKYRFVMKESNGINQLPIFRGHEAFYKNFIVTASNLCFNRHLSDALISEIIELNETNFNFSDVADDKEIEVDLATKREFYICIKSMRLLAKFLGFIESLPYQTEAVNWSQNLMATYLKVRGQVQPNFDIKTILEESIRRQSVILCIPWLTNYLAMLDYVTLRLPYYTLVSKVLFELYRNFNNFLEQNMYLVKFCLGWLFELPHFPDIEYFSYCIETKLECSPTMSMTTISLDRMNIIDQNVIYLCCPYLEEIKKILLPNSTTNAVTIKHITPVTAIQTPDELARKKLEQQLEEAFFNGQPTSLRKTSEFVSERVASTCVKFLVNVVVPKYKKHYSEKFKNTVQSLNNTNEKNKKTLLEIDKETLNCKAKEFAEICLKELQQICENEVRDLCEHRIKKAIESLVGTDILQQTKDVCINITKKGCIERIKQWILSHVILTIFAKDFDEVILKISGPSKPKRDKPSFALPPEGSNVEHNEDAISAAHLLEKIRNLSVDIFEKKPISIDVFTQLLDDVLKTINERADVNECITATICTSLVDLSLLLLSHDANIINDQQILSNLTEIWKNYYLGTDELFKMLFCTRNVRIFAQSDNIPSTWTSFANFCTYLIKNRTLSCENFESQCTGIFRTDWDQADLKYITNFLKKFVILYKEIGGNGEDFTFLLDFLSDYCEDL